MAQSTAVRAGHGDSTTSTGAKRKADPTYHDEPAWSQRNTKRNHRGIGGSIGAGLVGTFTLTPVALKSLKSPPSTTLPPRGQEFNYLKGSGWY